MNPLVSIHCLFTCEGETRHADLVISHPEPVRTEEDYDRLRKLAQAKLEENPRKIAMREIVLKMWRRLE